MLMNRPSTRLLVCRPLHATNPLTRRARRGGDRSSEPRLADPGFTGNEHRPSSPRRNVVEHHIRPSKLDPPPDERTGGSLRHGGRQQTIAELTVADRQRQAINLQLAKR